MNSQTKIILLLFLVSIEITFINADFEDDRANLGDCYKTLLVKLKKWSRYDYSLPTIDPIPAYEEALTKVLTIDLQSFKNTTMQYFNLLVFETQEVVENEIVTISSIDFDENPGLKASAIVQVCLDIENSCPAAYHAPNIPLVGYLESLYDKTGVDKSDFTNYCETAADERAY